MSVVADRPSQIQSALDRANEIRRERARLVGYIGRRASGKPSPERVAELLLDPPEALWKMGIQQLLEQANRYGPGRAERLLGAEGISGTRLVRELTERQRVVIADRLRGKR